MRAGAVLSLLVCLVAVSQGTEVILNPEFDGCYNSVVPSWTGSKGTFSHADNPGLFEPGTIPAGDTCFSILYSVEGLRSLTQTITVPSTGTYDFSGLVACVSYADEYCINLLYIDGNFVPITSSFVTGKYPTIYTPITYSGYSLTAGDHEFFFLLSYVAENTVSAYVSKLSLVPAAGGSGDPHMVGFQGQRFDYIGEPGQVINLVTDLELQVNSLLDLQKKGENSFIPGPVMMEMAFMTRGHTVIVNAGGHQKDQIGFVSVDGVLLPLGQSFLNGLLSVTFTVLDTNSRHLGLTGNDHIVAQVDVKLEGMYEFRVFMIENGKDNLHHAKWLTDFPRRFLDFNASLLDLDRRPHGVLGQTAAPLGKERSVGEWTIEGKDEDYVVKDGLTGSQFSFNLFF